MMATPRKGYAAKPVASIELPKVPKGPAPGVDAAGPTQDFEALEEEIADLRSKLDTANNELDVTQRKLAQCREAVERAYTDRSKL